MSKQTSRARSGERASESVYLRVCLHCGFRIVPQSTTASATYNELVSSDRHRRRGRSRSVSPSVGRSAAASFRLPSSYFSFLCPLHSSIQSPTCYNGASQAPSHHLPRAVYRSLPSGAPNNQTSTFKLWVLNFASKVVFVFGAFSFISTTY